MFITAAFHIFFSIAFFSFLSFFLSFFWHRVLIYSPGWPDLEFTLSSQVLRLQTCNTTSGFLKITVCIYVFVIIPCECVCVCAHALVGESQRSTFNVFFDCSSPSLLRQGLPSLASNPQRFYSLYIPSLRISAAAPGFSHGYSTFFIGTWIWVLRSTQSECYQLNHFLRSLN